MLPNGTLIDKYEILEGIYKGPFSQVYFAKDKILNTDRAIKILPNKKAAEIARSINEAQISHKCIHKHIVLVHEANAYEIEGSPALVISMEYLTHGSVHQRLKSNFISCHEAVSHIINILKGLSHAHSKGIVHGDIKPANVMLCEKVGSKLSDFGLAIDIAANMPEARADYAYMTHMAPELFQPDGSNTFLSDMFAVGSTLFRLINNIYGWNERIYEIKNYDKHLQAGTIIGKKIQYEPFIPTKLRRIVNKACASDANSRFRNAQEMKQQLERLSPNIDWIRENDTYWTGRKGKVISEIEITKKRNWKVDIKVDDRRKTDICRQFTSLEAAETYLNNYIANSIYE
jgi:serine/threonine protein kinase